jgi:hypothetical protein
MNTVQSASAEGSVDNRAVDPGCQQLPPADNPVLLTSNDPN